MQIHSSGIMSIVLVLRCHVEVMQTIFGVFGEGSTFR